LRNQTKKKYLTSLLKVEKILRGFNKILNFAIYCKMVTKIVSAYFPHLFVASVRNASTYIFHILLCFWLQCTLPTKVSIVD
jgi:hypothetical protein